LHHKVVYVRSIPLFIYKFVRLEYSPDKVS